MTVMLTPERQPFFAGTYFPPRDGDRGAGAGFSTILAQINDRYVAEGSAMAARGRHHGEAAASVVARRRGRAICPAWKRLRNAAARLLARVRHRVRRLRRRAQVSAAAPTVELLLRYHRRTGDADALHMAVYTLERMAAGGIHDHVGGGFHRYATDARWLVPHFEKMLYDNALLAVVYLEAYQARRARRLRPGRDARFSTTSSAR